jgi:hypothetical protein
VRSRLFLRTELNCFRKISQLSESNSVDNFDPFDDTRTKHEDDLALTAFFLALLCFRAKASPKSKIEN